VISGWRLGSVQSKMSDTDIWWGERNSAVDGSGTAERKQQPCFREGLCFNLNQFEWLMCFDTFIVSHPL